MKKSSLMKQTRGAIAIFLAMLMMPFVTIAGALINAARFDSAYSVYYQSMSNAADSTLAEWDPFLKKRFGLMAVEQKTTVDETNSALTTTFTEYLGYNTETLSNTYMTTRASCVGMYSLADKNVLLNQIMEYSKYSVPTKLILDGINIDRIISDFENMIPGHELFGFFSSGADLGGAIMDLGTAMDGYEDASHEVEEAQKRFTEEYRAFETALSNLSSKKAERERTVQEYESKISNKSSEVAAAENNLSQLSDEAKTLTDQRQKYEDMYTALKNLEKEGVTVLSQERIKEIDPEGLVPDNIQKTVGAFLTYVETVIEDLDKKLDETAGENSSAYKEYQRLKGELSRLQSEYDGKLRVIDQSIAELTTTAETCKTDYLAAIDDYILKLNAQKAAMKQYDSAIEKASASVVSYADSTYDTLKNIDKDSLKDIKENAEKEQADAQTRYQSGKIDEDEYNAIKERNQYIIQFCDTAINNDDNGKTIADNTKDAINGVLEEVSEDLQDYDEAWFDAQIAALTALKTNVSAFSVSSVGSSFSAASFQNTYYKDLFVVTEQMVKDAEDKVLAELTKSSIWTIIKTLIDVITSLIKMALPFDPNLNTDIDRKYYESYDWSNLESGNDEDRALSEYYRELFGSYSATDLSATAEYSLVESLLAVFDDLIYIKTHLISSAIASLFSFGSAWKEIEARFDDIKIQFSNILSWVKNVAKTAYEKILLAGYLSYSTSCRTTYESGKSLTGASFNLRGQSGTLEEYWDTHPMNSIGDFVGLFKTVFTGENNKCFVGAETEYLINGSDNEIVNQLFTFLEIYGLRLVLNLYTVVTNPEIASIAAATTIGAPIVYLAYILLEPLIDTMLITGGGGCYLIKSQPWMVPSGLASLFKEVTGLAANNAQINKKKQQFEDAVNKYGNSGAIEDYQAYHLDTVQSENNTVEAVNDGVKKMGKFTYQDYLLLYLMFCSPEKLLDRFRDIVEMESVQNLYEKSGGGSWEGIKFDLSHSYTYLRVEGGFQSNSFIRVTDDDYSYEKIILYRGY